MRLPAALCTRNGRSPQQINNVPFQEILPLRIRNAVSGKGDKTSDVACLQEMSVLFACLKDNEFTEKFCPKEIASFQKCYKVHLTKRFEASRQENQGIVTPGKNLHYKQLNKYLRRYPNPV